MPHWHHLSLQVCLELDKITYLYLTPLTPLISMFASMARRILGAVAQNLTEMYGAMF